MEAAPARIDLDDDVAAPGTWVDSSSAPLSPRRALAVIAAVYFLSSLVAGPVVPGTPSPHAHWKLGPIYLGRPIATWGDPPHYLAIVNSLISDGDLDLRNNYDQAEAGGWDVGTRFRGTHLDRHAEPDARGQQLSIHGPYLPLLLASVAWPFRGTEWVESVCIWTTLAATLVGLWWCMRLPGFTPGWVAALALATPLWVYARDPWTEPYQAAAWAGLLALEHPLALGVLAFGAVLLKPTFVIVPLALAAVTYRDGERARARALASGGVLAVALAIAVAQYCYRDTDHFSLFHLAAHGHRGTLSFQPRWQAPLGLLFDPQDGLLFFCPFVVLGIAALREDRRLWVPAAAFYLLNSTYNGWRAGAGVSARYLIPMLPVLVLAVSRARPRGRLTVALVAYSAAVAAIGGILPVAAFDKTPWGMVQFLAARVGLLFG